MVKNRSGIDRDSGAPGSPKPPDAKFALPSAVISTAGPRPSHKIVRNRPALSTDGQFPPREQALSRSLSPQSLHRIGRGSSRAGNKQATKPTAPNRRQHQHQRINERPLQTTTNPTTGSPAIGPRPIAPGQRQPCPRYQRTRRTMAGRDRPSAMRIAISWDRSATENAITLLFNPPDAMLPPQTTGRCRVELS